MESFATIGHGVDTSHTNQTNAAAAATTATGIKLRIELVDGEAAKVLDELTGKTLCTITTEDDILHLDGNALAASITYECTDTRSMDVMFNPRMPPPGKGAQMTATVITDTPKV